MTPLSELLDARVLRVDLPSATELCLTLGTSPRSSVVLLFWLGPNTRGVGIVPNRPKGDAANAFVGKLRKELVGARLDSAARVESGDLQLRFVRGEEIASVVVAWFREGGHVTLRAPDGRILVQHRSAPTVHSATGERARNVPVPETLDALMELGQRLASGEAESDLEELRTALDRDLRRVAERTLKRSRAIREDLAKGEAAPALRRDAEILLANLHRVREGETTVELEDWFTDPPVTRRFSIDPKLGAKGQAQALFERAKRLDRGRPVALERQRKADDEYDALEALRGALATARSAAEIRDIESRALPILAGAVAPRSRTSKDAAPAAERLPHRIFQSTSGRPIWVGKSAKDNDALTLKFARPHHLWLHARGVAGSHVVVPLEKNESCPADLLVDAAHLAAHFSDGTGQDTVEVTYVPRRYLRKPRGSAAGSVVVTQEKVLRLRVESDRLQRLLASKQA